MACDIEQLLEDGKCFQSLSEDAQMIVIAQLLCDIVTSGVSTGGGVSQGAGAPASNPANTAIPWLYTDLNTGVIYTWNVTTQAWV